MRWQKLVCRATVPRSLSLGASEVFTFVSPLQLWMCFPLFRLFAVLEGLCNLAKIYLVLVVFLDGKAGGESEGQIAVPCKCGYKVHKGPCLY